MTRPEHRPTVYLAGPDVFFADAADRFDRLEAACGQRGLQGLRPSDGGLSAGLAGSGDEIAERIYRANVDLIRRCDAVLAQLMPFRNLLEPDSGTVFEVGMAVALGKPVAGVLATPDASYEARVARVCGRRRDERGLAWDEAHGYLIEEFGQPLNLMLSRSVALFADEGAALDHLAVACGSGRKGCAGDGASAAAAAHVDAGIGDLLEP